MLSAEPLLMNPALFSEERSPTGEPPCPEDPCNLLLEYLDMCEVSQPASFRSPRTERM